VNIQGWLMACVGVLSAGHAQSDTYDPATQQLSISSITVAGVTYRAVVTVGSVLGFNTGVAGTVDTYDAASNILTIPRIVVGGVTYTNAKGTVAQVVSASVISPGPTGTMKLFFNAEILGPKAAGDAQINLRSASSTDGFNFTLDPDIWATSDTLSDPVVYRSRSGRWFVAGFSEKEGIRVASHADTPNFATSTFSIAVGKGQVPALLEFDDGLRLYYLGEGGILSAFSKDGSVWTAEAGVRVGPPAGSNLVLVADPAPARRKDGSIVMYFKAAGPPGSNPSPYDHMIYRATSTDGLNFTHENELLVNHASVPQAFNDASGRVGVYFLDFRKFPASKEVIAAVYEQDDFTLTAPQVVSFDRLPANTWANDPTPVLIP
jgi:hypothetical protein